MLIVYVQRYCKEKTSHLTIVLCFEQINIATQPAPAPLPSTSRDVSPSLVINADEDLLRGLTPSPDSHRQPDPTPPTHAVNCSACNVQGWSQFCRANDVSVLREVRNFDT